MARYTKSDENLNSCFDYFVAWDEAKQGAESSEATHERDLFKPMNATDAARFTGMGPGEVFTRDGYEYFREW